MSCGVLVYFRVAARYRGSGVGWGIYRCKVCCDLVVINSGVLGLKFVGDLFEIVIYFIRYVFWRGARGVEFSWLGLYIILGRFLGVL